jgi:muramidase (phage lysozyme)
VLVGGILFTDLSRQPEKLVRLDSALSSTAAGRYQFLKRARATLQARLKLPDLGPLSQDNACIELNRAIASQRAASFSCFSSQKDRFQLTGSALVAGMYRSSKR